MVRAINFKCFNLQGRRQLLMYSSYPMWIRNQLLIRSDNSSNITIRFLKHQTINCGDRRCYMTQDQVKFFLWSLNATWAAVCGTTGVIGANLSRMLFVKSSPPSCQSRPGAMHQSLIYPTYSTYRCACKVMICPICWIHWINCSRYYHNL